MRPTQIVLAAASVLLLLGATDASAARRQGRHPGHDARPRIATYTMPARPRHVLRTAQASGPGPHARIARVRQDARALQAARAPAWEESRPRVAQGPRYHSLMRGS